MVPTLNIDFIAAAGATLLYDSHNKTEVGHPLDIRSVKSARVTGVSAGTDCKVCTFD